jgi:hypothetical protein
VLWRATASIEVPAGTYDILLGNWDYASGSGSWYDRTNWHSYALDAGYTYTFTKTNYSVAPTLVKTASPTVDITPELVDVDGTEREFTVTFSEVTDADPVLGDFTVEYKLNDGALTTLDISEYTYNFIVNANFKFKPFIFLDPAKVEIFVTWHGETVSYELELEGTPPLDFKIEFNLHPAAVTVAKGKTVQLVIETNPVGIDFAANDYTVEWKSLSTAKATVNATGLVTGKAAGVAVIQATITGPTGDVTIINYTVTVK